MPRKNAPATNEKQMTDEEMKNLIRESSKDSNAIFLVAQTMGSSGTGFAQFALEGRIDAELSPLTAIAIKRQLPHTTQPLRCRSGNNGRNS